MVVSHKVVREPRKVVFRVFNRFMCNHRGRIAQKGKAENLNIDDSFDKLVGVIVKDSDKIVIGAGIVSLPFLASFFWGNYTGTAIGLVLLGGAITLKIMVDARRQSKALWYMWLAILVLIAVLLGVQYVIPKMTFG